MRKLEASGVIMLDADEMVASADAWAKRRAELPHTVLPAGDGVYTFAEPPLMPVSREFLADILNGDYDPWNGIYRARVVSIEVMDGRATYMFETTKADTPAKDCGCNGTPE